MQSVEAGVDDLTPTILQYDRPRTGLEGKFSLHYCAAAALVDGRIDLETFEDARVAAPDLQAFLPRVTMDVDPTLDPAAPRLTQVALTVRLADGRTLRETRTGARGHPRPAGDRGGAGQRNSAGVRGGRLGRPRLSASSRRSPTSRRSRTPES